MPEISMIDGCHLSECLAAVTPHTESARIGASVYEADGYVSDATVKLGGGTYAIAMHEDLATWEAAIAQLDRLAPGRGGWLVTDSVSFGPVLVSIVRRDRALCDAA